MSIEALNADWKHSKSKGSRRLVLLALADYADDKGGCWPSFDTLAKKCNMSRRYVIDCMADLEKMGEIEKEERFEHGRHTSNYYHILIVNHSSPPDRGDSEQGCTTGGEQEFTRVVNHSSLKPSVNHHVEPSLIEEEETPEFVGMRDMLSELTGCLPTPDDIKGIEQCVSLGVLREDIEGALQWRKDNLRGPVKTITQLVPGIITNRSMRVQTANAKPSGNNHRGKQRKLSKLEQRRRELANGK